MKRLVALLLGILLLTGCGNGSKEIERGMALRTRLLQEEKCVFDVEITADYGDRLYTFHMNCEGDREGNLVFSVTEPESIAGITGRICEEGGILTFDETALYFDTMAEGQISPVSAPWIFLRTLREGYLTSAGTEGEYLRLTIDDSYEEDALQLDIWLDSDDCPVRSEVLYANRRILSIEVENFRFR